MADGIPAVATRHFLRDRDLTADELRRVLTLAADVKENPARYRRALDGESVVLLFEKPSLRTRMTFQLAAAQLGAFSAFQDHRDGRIGEREPARDIARNLDRWFGAIVARTYAHRTLELLAKWSSVPVVNALSEACHPCQALADFLTLREQFGSFEGLKMTYVGDGNNVAHSLLHCAAQLGVSITMCAPSGYELRAEEVASAREAGARTGSVVEVVQDPPEALDGAHAVYTDVWTSMGWEEETQRRMIAFTGYEVTDRLMSHAHKDAVFMHCLPAQRGQEVSDSVMESKRSVVFDQAENRLHAHKALLLVLMQRSWC